MKKANEPVRTAARVAGVPLWAVANRIGVSEPTLLRWLRIPLSEEKEKDIMEAISELGEEWANG